MACHGGGYLVTNKQGAQVMSVYQKTYDLCADLPTDRIEHRLRCDEGVIGSNASRERQVKAEEQVRAYKAILAEREGRPVDQLDEEQDAGAPGDEGGEDLPIEYMIAIKYKNLYDSAQRRGKEFDLTFKDIRRLLERKTCAYTGIRLTEHRHRRESRPTDRSFDRLDPRKGYVKGNVFAVSNRANHVKNELFESANNRNRISLKEVMALCDTLSKAGFIERD